MNNTLKTVKTPVLWKMVGGLSEPSKMPCHGYSISAKDCKTGSRLHEVEGSVCAGCYARKGNYMFPKIQTCLKNRLALMLNDVNWIENMSELINRKEYSGYFRWFDSGDVQSVQNLKDIVAVCNLTPTIKHWLPTKEYKFVSAFIKAGGVIPDNLTIRLSGYFIDMPGPKALADRLGVLISGITRGPNYNCLAPSQDNECRTCRRCWDKNVPEIVYKKH